MQAGQKPPASRGERLVVASQARAKGRRRRAIAEYHKLLAEDPDDYDVHRKLAPLLVKARREQEAWESFMASADGYQAQGFCNKAIAVYARATDCLPRQPQAWENLARLKAKRGHKADAIYTLLCGRSHLLHSTGQPAAIRLLRAVRELEPWHFEATLDLATSLLREGETLEPRLLLHELVPRARSRDLRRVRWALFRLMPTPHSAWRWLRACLFRR